MISTKELNNVVETIVPMYFTMAMAFISMRWWKIFTPEQCNGIGRFIKALAIPLLSFQIIASHDLYAVDFKFFAADSLQKIVVLAALFLWKSLSKNGSLEWVITLFSASSFPIIFLMAVPVVEAMYGAEPAAALVVQTGIFQAVIWMNVLIFLYEYREVKLSMISSDDDGVVSDHAATVMKSSEGTTGLQLSTVHVDCEGGLKQRDDADKKMENLKLAVFVQNSNNLNASKEVDLQTVASSRGSAMTRHVILMLWKRIIKNPNTYATLFGVAWSLISFRYHIKMPTMLNNCFSMLSDTCLAMNMFNLGTFLALKPNIISCTKWEAISIMVVRFLVSPMVIAATSKAIGLHGIALRTSIMEAVFPQAAVCFVFAKEYNVHPNILSTLVAAGLLVALPLLLMYYVLLGAV